MSDITVTIDNTEFGSERSSNDDKLWMYIRQGYDLVVVGLDASEWRWLVQAGEAAQTGLDREKEG